MSAFTPGPWQVGWGNRLTGPRCGPTVYLDGTNTHRVPIRSGDQPVCWLLSSAKFTSADDLAPDAGLIAASPDLYRELRHLVNLLQTLEAVGSLSVPGLATLNGARKALAKAEGRDE
jgi:hypothetical protein